MDVGLLLSLPTESIAVRVALASLVAVLLARLLMGSGVRTPRARAALALVPGVAVVVVVGVYATQPAPPSLWHTVNASGGLTVPVRDTYLSFAPAAVPLLVGLWAVIAASRVAVRVLRHRRSARRLCQLAREGRSAPASLDAVAAAVATSLRIAPPRVVLVPHLPGGAAIVGLRAPLLLLDADLAGRLDREELEGVLAHELAHVQRRDNLVALGLCVLRDVLFFVPGGAWSLRMLLREREHAADTVAVDVTGRPGALAGGLLKVLESRGGRTVAACSPLLSEGTLVARVEALCDDRASATRRRRTAEAAAVASVVAAAVAAAAVVPSMIAGDQQQREALGVLLSDVHTSSTPDATSTVFRAFERATGATTAPTADVATATEDDRLLDVAPDDLAGAVGFEACARGVATCLESSGPRVSLVPEPIVRVDDDAVDGWRLEPIVRSDSQENALFWFRRLAAG